MTRQTSNAANLENVAAEVLLVCDLESDPLALLRDRRARLDFVVLVAARFAVCRHDEAFLHE